MSKKTIIVSFALLSIVAVAAHGDNDHGARPRPYYLVEKMTDSPLKHELEQCAENSHASGGVHA